MEITYKREMKHNYLILSPGETDHCGYEKKMLVSNHIEGLLRFRLKYLDSKEYFYYEITSKQPLKRLLENRLITLGELRGFMIQIIQTMERMESYLLKDGQILLEEEYIYVTPEYFEVFLCVVPGRTGDFPEEMSKLLQYLLGKVDHQDKECVVLAYGLYQASLKENYGMEDIMELLMRESETKEVNLEPEPETAAKPAEPYHDIKEKEPVESSRFGLRGRILGCVGMMIVGAAVLFWLVGFPQMLPYAIIACVAQVVIWLWLPGIHKKEDITHGERQIPKPKDDTWQWKAALEEFEEEPAEINTGREPEKNSVRLSENQGDTVLLVNLEGQKELHKLVSLDQEEDIVINYFPFIIGKQEGLVDYVLLKDTVSRLHLKIDHIGEEFQVVDLNSTNGTKINGRLLDSNEMSDLAVGDEIIVANMRFRFI